MLLKQIFSGSVFCEFLLVKDTCMIGSGNLLKELAKQNLNRGITVYLFSFENRLNDLFSCFRSHKNFKIHDVFSSLSFLDDKKNSEDLIQTVLKNALLGESILIIVDSINIYLQIYGMSPFTTAISKTKVRNKMGELVYSVAGVAHWDDEALSETALGKQLERLASSVLTLTASETSSKPSVSVLHKKPSGRHITQKCEWWLMGDRVEIKETPKEKPQSSVVVEAETPKPLTTFRIELDDQEKASRDNLVLPYMKHMSGKIHYEPDENDDWDDEDPDDDLDV